MKTFTGVNIHVPVDQTTIRLCFCTIYHPYSIAKPLRLAHPTHPKIAPPHRPTELRVVARSHRGGYYQYLRVPGVLPEGVESLSMGRRDAWLPPADMVWRH